MPPLKHLIELLAEPLFVSLDPSQLLRCLFPLVLLLVEQTLILTLDLRYALRRDSMRLLRRIKLASHLVNHFLTALA